MFRKNVAGQFIHVQGVDSATGGIKSGVSWTVRRCIDGTFAAATGTATEDGTAGWYKFAMSQADTNGNNIGFNFTGTGAIPQTVNIVTTACDPTTATNFGITALPAVASGSAGAVLVDGTGTAAISNSAGKVLLQATQSGVTIPTVTTVTNQLTAAQIATGIFQDTTAGDFTVAASIGKSIMNGVALGTGLTVNDLTTKTGFSLTAAYDAAKTASQAGDAMTLTAAYDSAKTALTTAAQTESYRANGATGTVTQLLYEILGHLGESSISSTTKTVKKLDHSTTAATFTLDSATTPSSITRAT